VIVDLNPQDGEKMYHIPHIGKFKSNKIKVLVSVIALFASVTAANFDSGLEAERCRTARTSANLYKKTEPLNTQRTSACSSLMSDIGLFLRVLSSGPFGLYSGWRARKKTPVCPSYKPFRYPLETKTYTRKRPIRRK
jgi:hypothetical protein